MQKIKRFLCGVLGLALLILAVPGCNGPVQNGGNDRAGRDEQREDLVLERYENRSGEGFFYRQERLPGPVLDWVENASGSVFLGQSRIFEDYLYILVTYGPRPTGGYAVEITDVLVEPESVTVEVHFTRPSPGDTVTQAFTYPYDLVLVHAVDLPLYFYPSGDEEYMMTLWGIDFLETIAAGSDWIKLFEPAPGDNVEGVLRFRGVASVFEGHIEYRVLDQDGEILTGGYTMAGMGDWCYFAENIELAGLVDAEEPVAVTLELFTTSPKDGSEQDKVSVQVKSSP